MLTRSQCPVISCAPIYLEQGSQTHAIPLYASRVSAGYPMPADDYIDQVIHLDRHLVKHPESTFMVIASGDSMVNAGIQSGDMLVVDRKILPAHGNIVVAAVDGELTVKRLSLEADTLSLLPENPAYRPIAITPEQQVVLWGVVTLVIAKSPR
jgi:DNA polymerase V